MIFNVQAAAKFIMSAGLLAALSAATAAAAARPVDLAPTAKVIERALAMSTMPGMVVAVTDRHRTQRIVVHGYADLKRRIPLTADSLFAIGSISKSFTAVALMQLSQEKRFDPTIPLVRYLPSFGVQSTFRDITGHDLLSHTAGLPSYIVDASSSRFALTKLHDFAPRYPPGEHFWYSNTGFQVLGYALENIEGTAYPTIVQRRIFDRLGMHSSAAVIDDAIREKLTVSYQHWPYDGSYVESPWFEYAAADGSIVSNAADLCAYLRFILNRGAIFDERGHANGRLLDEEAFQRLTTPVLDDYAYGLRVRHIRDDTVIGHGGAIGGFKGLVEAHMNDGFGLVLLSNGGIDSDFRQWVINLVTAAYRGEPLPPAPSLKERSDEQRFAGQYRLANRPVASENSLKFEFIGGKLVLDAGDGHVPLRRMGAGLFRDSRANGAEAFVFSLDDAAGLPATQVSQGAAWYFSPAFKAKTESAAPPEYSAYVGHFESNGPEGPAVRVFVRNGRLLIDPDVTAEKPDVLLSTEQPGVFRFAAPDYNPELLRFDTVVDGHALRLDYSGVPLYRKDTP